MSIFAEMVKKNWSAATVRSYGVPAEYHQGEDTTALQCVLSPRDESLALDVAWEVAAKQAEVFAAASDVPETFSARQDSIVVAGVTYTVMERRIDGALCRFVCEREEIESVRHRGRRF